jgi:hypothetical protein
MADTRLRELERQVTQNPHCVDTKRRWLMARARVEPTTVKTFYKIRCGNKWLSTSGYRQQFTAQGTRHKSQADATHALLRFIKYCKRQRIQFTEPSVEIVAFEVHTLEAKSDTIDLVDAAKQAELAEIRAKKEELEKAQQKLLEQEQKLLEQSNKKLQEKLKANKKK